MVRLPSVDTIRKRLPQSSEAVQNIPVAQDGRGLQVVGQSIGRAAGALFQEDQRRQRVNLYNQRLEQQRENELKKFEAARMKNFLDEQANELVQTIDQDPDYQSYGQKLNDGFKQIHQQYNKSITENPLFKDDPLSQGYLNLYEREIYNAARDKIQKSQNTKQNDYIVASVNDSATQFTNLYASVSSEDLPKIEDRFNTMVMSAVKVGAMTRTQAVKAVNGWKVKSQRNRLNALPSEQVLSELSGGKSGEATHYLKMAAIEANYKNNAVNGKHEGLYQLSPDIAKKYGVKNTFDAGESLKGAMGKDSDDAKYFKEIVGRKPQNWERYLIHQQGLAGAPALIANPDKNVVEVLSEFYSTKEKARMAVVGNGGRVDMTAREFANLWRDKYNKIDILDAPQELVTLITQTVGGSGKGRAQYDAIPLSEKSDIYKKAVKDYEEKAQKQAVETVLDVVTTKYPDNFEAQIKIVDGLDLPVETRKDIKAVLNSNRREREAIQREKNNEISGQVLEFIKGGRPIEEVDPELLLQIDSTDRTYLTKYSERLYGAKDKKLEKQEERLLFSDVQDAYYQGGVGALQQFNRAELAYKLNDTHYNQYSKWLNEAKEPNELPTVSVAQVNRIAGSAALTMGLNIKKNTEHKKIYSIFRERLDVELEEFALENGRPPKVTETQEIRDRLIKQYVTKEGWISDTTQYAFQLTDAETAEYIETIEDIPSENLREIEAELRGLYPSLFAYEQEALTLQEQVMNRNRIDKFIIEIYKKELVE